MANDNAVALRNLKTNKARFRQPAALKGCRQSVQFLLGQLEFQPDAQAHLELDALAREFGWRMQQLEREALLRAKEGLKVIALPAPVLSPREVELSNPTRIRMAMVDWNSIPVRLWGKTMEDAIG